jgi:hypothetical protein
MGTTLLDDGMVQLSLLWTGALFVALIWNWLHNPPATADGAWRRTNEGGRAA